MSRSHGEGTKVESPRRPLQRGPHPSGSDLSATGSPHFPSSPTRHSPTRSHLTEQSQRMEVAFLSQRFSSLEDRFQGLESLVSRLAGKVESLVRSSDHDKRDMEGHRVRVESLEEQLAAIQKATSDFGSRVMHHDRSLDALREQSQLHDTAAARHSVLEQRIDEVHRIAKRAGDDSNKQAALLRNQLGQATKLLQTYTRRQCEALSAEHAARLDTFEGDRKEIIRQVSEVCHGMNETRVVLADFRAQLATMDHTLHKQDELNQTYAEDIKVVQRRLLSALRHLSVDTTAYLSQPRSPTATGNFFDEPIRGAPLGGNNGSPSHTYSPSFVPASAVQTPHGALATSSAAAMVTSGSTPRGGGHLAHHEDAGIDQFIAELNFMSRNAVL